MNVIRPPSADAPSPSEANNVAAIVYDIVGSLGGTFSAVTWYRRGEAEVS